MQLTITLYLAGLSLGQLVSGPLADHLGRRPLLLGGSRSFWLVPSGDDRTGNAAPFA
jgi:MFS family permease